MRKYLLAAGVLLPLALANCSTTASVTSATYSADLTFDAAVKSFNGYKKLCIAKVIPASCRTYVVQGQGYIKQAYAYEQAGNSAAAQATLDSLLAVVSSLKSL